LSLKVSIVSILYNRYIFNFFNTNHEIYTAYISFMSSEHAHNLACEKWRMRFLNVSINGLDDIIVLLALFDVLMYAYKMQTLC